MMRHILFQLRESSYVFFYDETNNIRKFYLRNGGFNVPEDSNFVLGGIFYDKGSSNPNFEEMFNSLGLQKNITEVKLKHIGKGNFIDILNSEKMSIILEWSINNIYLHYINVDIFYWGIVDIVDSTDGVDHTYNREFKKYLYKIVNSNREISLRLLHEYDYPNIKRLASCDFKNKFHEFVMNHIDLVNDEHKEVFTNFMNMFLNTNEFPFIMDEDDNMLIDNFYHFYTYRMQSFPKSEHILDIEEEIIEKINAIKDVILPGIQFKFVDSKGLREIQLSDIMTGFLGKYFTYIKNTEMQSILDDEKSFTERQKKNLSLLANLIVKSDHLTPLSLQSIMSDNEIEKNNYLLFHQ